VFLEFDKEVLAQDFVKSAGSTCTIATIFGDALILANVGDSDAFLCRDGIARRLTVHHKAIDPQESKRIWQSGGVVLGDRVSGMLEVRVSPCPLSSHCLYPSHCLCATAVS
jgi:serine/threonine protein phosphatase PrpC